MEKLPEVGDVVVVKITKVLNYGVFVDLLEFEGLSGFVHISQVASSWIKNIRNFVKENQIRAAKVLKVDPAKQQIDLSLEKVSPRLQRARIEEYKQSKRCQKLIELMAKQQKKDFNLAWKEVAEPLLEKYGSLYEAFEAIALDGAQAAAGVPKNWLKPLVGMVKKNIEAPRKTVKGVVELHSLDPQGADVIKAALAGAKKAAKNVEVDISYQGSSKFLVKVTASDFKAAKKSLEEICQSAIDFVKGKQGEGSFKILEK